MADENESSEKEMGLLIDASGEQPSLSVQVPTERTVKEVVTMMMGEDDMIFGRGSKAFGRKAHRAHRSTILGRMPVLLDESDFDAMPPLEVDMLPSRNPELYSDSYHAGAKGDAVVNEFPEYEGADEHVAPTLQRFLGDDEETPAMFESPAKTELPIFTSAFAKFKKASAKPRVVRIDTDATHGDFVCESAVREIGRRVDELRDALEEHMADGSEVELPKWDVLGAAEAIADLKASTTPKEAMSKMTQVPLDLPPFAEGKIKCWHDGDSIVCSIRFEAADGSVRIATMAAKPNVDADEVANWAMDAGVDPTVVLGALPDLAAVATGKRLVRDICGAALKIRNRMDVCGMDSDEDVQPLLLASGESSDSPAVAALMHVEQRADAGDAEAATELAKIQAVASTPEGGSVTSILGKSSARLAAGQSRKALGGAKKPTFFQRYALAAGWTI